MKKNQYLETAAFYDFLTAQSGIEDVPFYLAYAQEKGGEVLELACGTGRVAIPLARAGLSVHGIDLSAAMLAVFREKLSQEPPEVQERIQLSQQDLTSFSLDRSFDLIIIPFRSFQVLQKREEQLACLKNIRQHLKPDGHFILNVFAASPRIATQQPHFQREKEYNIPEGKLDILEGWTLDLGAQLISIDIVMNLTKPDGKQEERQENHELRYYFLPQVRELVQEAGFRILAEYGDYDGRAIGEGREYILVLNLG